MIINICTYISIYIYIQLVVIVVDQSQVADLALVRRSSHLQLREEILDRTNFGLFARRHCLYILVVVAI